MKLIRKVIIRKIFSARAQDKREDLEKCLCDILIQSWSTDILSFTFCSEIPGRGKEGDFDTCSFQGINLESS